MNSNLNHEPLKVGTPGDTTNRSSHIPVLDGIRGIAVLLVIWFHFWGSNGLVGKIAVWGQTGVDLFFVLSGFLITGILLDSKDSAHFLRNFYARRILRIFPLYYAALLWVYVIAPLLHLSAPIPWRQSIWFWLYAQNIAMTFQWPHAGPVHFWSLSVEEHYYFVWPFVVRMLSAKRLLWVSVCLIGLSIVTRIVLGPVGYFTLARMDALAIGSALALFARQFGGLARLTVPAKCGLLLVALLIPLQLAVSGKGLPVIQICKNTLIALFYAAIVVLALERRLGPVGYLLNSRFLRSVGKYSYAMYVLHPFLLAVLPGGRTIWGFPLAVAVIYGASYGSWKLLEERFLRLKRYFEYQANVPARAVSVGVPTDAA